MAESFRNLPDLHQRINTQMLATIIIAQSINQMISCADGAHTYIAETLQPMVNDDRSAAMVSQTKTLLDTLNKAHGLIMSASSGFELLSNGLDEYRL